MKSKEIPTLDGFRAFSVILVFLSHAGFGNIIPGGLGVTIFFFLSGYLITTLLLKEYGTTGRINFKYFYLRRFLRLFPPLLLTIVISYILVEIGMLGGGISVEGFLFQVFYLANYHSIFAWPGQVPHGTGILWSLAIEEHFYIFFPLLLLALIKIINKRQLATVLLIVCLLILFWRIMLVMHYQTEDIRTYYATDTRIDSILYGCVLALIISPERMQQDTSSISKPYLLLILGTLLIITSLVFRGIEFRETIRYTIQGIGLMPIFYFGIKHSNHLLFIIFNTSPIKLLGRLSYFIYLIHHIAIKSIQLMLPEINHYMLIIYAFTASLIYAALFDRYIDTHFSRLRAQFR